MKTLFFTFLMIFAAGTLVAQSELFGNTALKTLDGKTVNASEVLNKEGNTLVVFWKSNGTHQGESIENLHNTWTETLKSIGVKMVAVCVDGNGKWSHVKPMVNAHLWEFDVYVDVNGDFKRSLNGNVPGAMLINSNHEIVYRQNGYCSSLTDYYFEMIETNN